MSQPDTGEQALEIAEMLTRSGAIDLVVIDSVAALVPQKELDGEIGDSFVGLQARLMSQAMRKLTGAIAKSKTTVIFINQIREKIGVMFGNPETTTGGRALKFYSSIRADIRRIAAIKDGETVTGNRTKIKVVLFQRLHPKANAVERQRATLSHRHLQVLLTDHARVQNIQAPNCKGRFRIPSTERMKSSDLLNQLQRNLVKPHF